MMDLSTALRVALTAAREAGDLLRADLHPPDRPLGTRDTAALFGWAEGCGLVRRNGRVTAAALPMELAADDVVVVSSVGARSPGLNLECAAPARFRPVPSIAHRLALVAAGEAAAAISVH